jgi:hypothetical protein
MPSAVVVRIQVAVTRWRLAKKNISPTSKVVGAQVGFSASATVNHHDENKRNSLGVL